MGKTSLLRLVTGELTPSSGELVIGQRTQIALFDQTRSILNDDWSVFDNVADREGADRTGAGVIRVGERTYEMRTYLEQFSFRGIKQRQKAGALSGGERARLALAKVLSSSANLLLLDEPTNDLDIQTLGALEELLEGWAGCALIVSHDRYFLDRVATSLLVFEGDGKVVQYPGGYASYRSLKAQAEAQASATRETRRTQATESAKSAQPKSQRPPAPPATKRPLTYAERLELDGLLDRVTAAESTLSELEAELAKPGNYADAEAARRRNQEYERARALVGELTRRWEELEARR
jgi:ATP-binding cassette subfamily F protein uup